MAEPAQLEEWTNGGLEAFIKSGLSALEEYLAKWARFLELYPDEA